MLSIYNYLKSRTLLSIAVTGALCGQLALADSSVWKAEKDGRHIYLGGTIHVLKQDDYPLPEAFTQAYDQSAVVYFETDIAGLKDPEIAAKLMSALSAEEGKTLDKVLKPETLAALEAFLEKRGLPLEVFNTFSPSGLYLMLFSMELVNMGMTDAGVDEHFDVLARKDKKTLGQLETIDQQLSFFSKIGEGNEDQLVLYTLRDLETLPETMIEMKATWRSGDRAKYRELLLKPLVKDYPKTYEALLVERNNNWMPKIEALFETPEVELVLVGALHMIGKEGLLQQLERKGYTIEPFIAADTKAKQ